MSISDKTRKALEKIGLTSYEIRTFSALLKSGELTASDLSQKSGVPYSKIYEVLGTLEEKGWIGSDDSRPTKYFAKSPSTGFTHCQLIAVVLTTVELKLVTELGGEVSGHEPVVLIFVISVVLTFPLLSLVFIVRLY